MHSLKNWQQELVNDLGSKVKFDHLELQLYSTAACMYEVIPLSVVIPETNLKQSPPEFWRAFNTKSE